MHYYQFNIADYRKDTQHLTPMEHYIYRELMDWYYLDESPLPKETQRVTRRLRLGSENNQEVDSVLKEFFKEGVEGWSHRRIDKELNVYQAKAERARVNGSKGGRPKKPRKTQPVPVANPEVTQTKANHKPLTNNHKPLPIGINADAWGEFEQHRKEIKKPLSDLSRTKALNVIIDLPPDEQARVIDKTIQNRWSGLFAEKKNESNRSIPESSHARAMRLIQTRVAET